MQLNKAKQTHFRKIKLILFKSQGCLSVINEVLTTDSEKEEQMVAADTLWVPQPQPLFFFPGLAGICLVHPHEEQRLSRELGYLGTEHKGLLLPIPNPSEKNFHLLCGTLTGKVSHKKNEIQIIAWF